MSETTKQASIPKAVELLTPFLGEVSRFKFESIQRAHGRLFATNGKIIAWVSDDPTVSAVHESVSTEFINTLVARWPTLESIVLADPPVQCRECQGSGFGKKRVECEKCEGRGHCDHCDEMCRECMSEGRIEEADRSSKCRDCEGEKTVDRDTIVCGMKICGVYVSMLRRRSARVAAIKSPRDDIQDNALCFETAEGLRGIVMPITTRNG